MSEAWQHASLRSRVCWAGVGSRARVRPCWWGARPPTSDGARARPRRTACRGCQRGCPTARPHPAEPAGWATPLPVWRMSPATAAIPQKRQLHVAAALRCQTIQLRCRSCHRKDRRPRWTLMLAGARHCIHIVANRTWLGSCTALEVLMANPYNNGTRGCGVGLGTCGSADGKAAAGDNGGCSGAAAVDAPTCSQEVGRSCRASISAARACRLLGGQLDDRCFQGAGLRRHKRRLQVHGAGDESGVDPTPAGEVQKVRPVRMTRPPELTSSSSAVVMRRACMVSGWRYRRLVGPSWRPAKGASATGVPACASCSFRTRVGGFSSTALGERAVQ